jgi:hypothetical protein
MRNTNSEVKEVEEVNEVEGEESRGSISQEVRMFGDGPSFSFTSCTSFTSFTSFAFTGVCS